eukprot:14652509-Heterocapsa_arctica.AAC.1
MLREIELFLALASSIRIYTYWGPPIVEWDVPASKTDSLALGTTLAWGCTCENENEGAISTCAYHALK